MRFEGKTIVITGGSGGIGLATAIRIAEEGGRVLVTGTNAGKLEKANAAHERIDVLANDAGDPKAAEELGQKVKEMYGEIDGLFLNAGFGVFTPIEEVTSEQFDSQFNVNVRGPILHAKELGSLIKKGGSVLLNTSIAQNLGMQGAILYASTKGALRTATRVLAREMADRSIRVNAVSPGPIGTDFFDRTGMPEDQVKGMAEQIMNQVPLGRFGKPEEIAAASAFLLSDDASFMTGSEITVDGGMSQL